MLLLLTARNAHDVVVCGGWPRRGRGRGRGRGRAVLPLPRGAQPVGRVVQAPRPATLQHNSFIASDSRYGPRQLPQQSAIICHGQRPLGPASHFRLPLHDLPCSLRRIPQPEAPRHAWQAWGDHVITHSASLPVVAPAAGEWTSERHCHRQRPASVSASDTELCPSGETASCAAAQGLQDPF
jgi:hypothetical protein